MNKKIVYGAIAITFIVAVLALFIGIRSSGQAIVVQEPKTYGSNTGNDTNLSNLILSEQLTTGTVLSTSTPASMTLAASDLFNNSLVSIRLSVGAATVTLPASTTLNTAKFLPNAGDTIRFVIQNATTTAGSAGILTIAGGTGSTLNIATSTTATTMILNGGTNGGAAAVCVASRKVNTDYGFYCVPTIN